MSTISELSYHVNISNRADLKISFSTSLISHEYDKQIVLDHLIPFDFEKMVVLLEIICIMFRQGISINYETFKNFNAFGFSLSSNLFVAK